MRRDSTQDAINDPAQDQIRAGFIQAPASFLKRSGARASRHPPRWRAQLDIPETGRGRRIGHWQQSDPSFSFLGDRKREPRDSGSDVQRRGSVQKVDAKGRVSIPANYRPVLRDGDPNWSEGKAARIHDRLWR